MEFTSIVYTVANTPRQSTLTQRSMSSGEGHLYSSAQTQTISGQTTHNGQRNRTEQQVLYGIHAYNMEKIRAMTTTIKMKTKITQDR
eukprot:3493031-Heterocapsa_arctica.AAC.1